MQSENSFHDIFRREWVRWQPQIFAYIRTIVFQRADAEDLLQEVAAFLWSKIDEFEPGTRFDQWAYSVARFKLLEFQKKKGREKIAFSDSMEDLLTGEVESMLGGDDDLVDTLEICVQKLPLSLRTLLRQRYAADATSRSVAKAIGRSESTVSRTLSRIYRILMQCIESGGTRISTEDAQ